MNVTIREYQPSGDLLPFVQSYWLGNFNTAKEENYSQSVVPNGCIELIIHLTRAHCNLARETYRWEQSPDFTVLGLYTKPYEVKFHQHVSVFGIRFYPDGIRNVFGISPAKFLATYEDSTDVFGRKLKDFCGMIQGQATDMERFQLTNTFMKEQLTQNYRSYDYTHRAMQLIRKHAGNTNYKLLTNQIPISERQLQREFKTQYGITIMEYIRLARMNAIQRYMLNQTVNLTQLSYDLNFFDQSHFIREFRNYVGTTPKKFLKRRSEFIVNPLSGSSADFFTLR